jgi:hypothetical protein
MIVPSVMIAEMIVSGAEIVIATVAAVIDTEIVIAVDVIAKS